MNLFDLIFPKKCLSCNKEGGYICNNCILKANKPKDVCPVCHKASIDGFTHVKCKKKYGIDGLITLWNYEKVVQKAITALKYKHATQIVSELAKHAVIQLEKKEFTFGKDKCFVSQNYCLTPISLHWYRENDRGFNQSELLGKEIAKEMGWKFITNMIVRKKWVSPQVGLRKKQRKRNVKGIFFLNPIYLADLKYYSIILFDDVFTTGSTLKEAAKVLKRKGSPNVWGFTLAR